VDTDVWGCLPALLSTLIISSIPLSPTPAVLGFICGKISDPAEINEFEKFGLVFTFVYRSNKSIFMKFESI
jgi:hypothetical protein